MIVQNLIEELEDEISKLKDRCDELESEVELLRGSLDDAVEAVDDETDELWTIIHRIGNVLDLDPKLFDLKEPY